MTDALTVHLEGHESLLAKILALKGNAKSNLLRKAARAAARPLVVAVRAMIKSSVGISAKKVEHRRTRELEKLAAAKARRNREMERYLKRKLKPLGKKLKGVGKVLKTSLKSKYKFATDELKRDFNSIRKAIGWKPYKWTKRREKVTKRGRPPKKVKPAKAAKPKPVKKVRTAAPKTKYHDLSQLLMDTRNRIRGDLEQENLWKEARDNRRLLGNKRGGSGMVMESGGTGSLAKSVTFKISTAGVKKTAKDASGGTIGGTGITSYAGSASWNSAKWSSTPGKKIVLIVGAKSKPLIVFNPFTRKLVKIDPKRYLHLIEAGHVLKVRGQRKGRIKPYRVLAKTLALQRSSLEANLRAHLKKGYEDHLKRTGGS